MPEVPPLPGTAGLTGAVEAAFADGGSLARTLTGFEPRDSQRAMARAVARTMADGGVLLAEAGTGTGKTMAYLVPAVLSGERVLVSTGTKNLQEQIYFKDLPVLREALGVPFTATCMKGRANYLCLHRFGQYRAAADAGRQDSEARVFLPILSDWAGQTDTGDRAELVDLPEDLRLWHDVSATSETCLGTECPQHAECFVTRMRQRAAESQVVIVNHHLLCADASVRQGDFGEVIPECRHVVIDEAHQLEDVATQYFGLAVSNHRLDDLVRDGEALVATATSAAQGASLRRALARVLDHSRAFFSGLALARAARGTVEDRLRLDGSWFGEHLETGVQLSGALEGLEAVLGAAGATGVPAHDEDRRTVARRARELADALAFMLAASDPAYVYFLEMRGRTVTLRAAPIDVSGIVRELVLDSRHAAVLTSATLSVDGRFDYVRARLGITEADEVRLPSEFDYARQSLLYLPPRMPRPRDPGYADAVAGEVRRLLTCSRGRAFVLFTSYASMTHVVRQLEPDLPFPMLVQGSAPRSALLDAFRTTPQAVLFATASFWQGVDVQGEALSCVIVDKLPFASPGDPVTAARIDAVTAAGEEAFSAYQVPLAILTLQQGLGRLIRHRSDRGVLAVLDPRLRTMGYGRRFLDSLPPAPVTTDIRAVARFFGD